MSSNNGDATLCLKSKMATNEPEVLISAKMTYIIKIPTANPRHSTVANSQVVYLGDSNNNKWQSERQSEMAAETGNTYISCAMKGAVKISNSNDKYGV